VANEVPYGGMWLSQGHGLVGLSPGLETSHLFLLAASLVGSAPRAEQPLLLQSQGLWTSDKATSQTRTKGLWLGSLTTSSLEGQALQRHSLSKETVTQVSSEEESTL
jgi:hypothetical protein